MAATHSMQRLREDNLFEQSLRLFFLLFLAHGALLAGLLVVVYQVQTDDYLERLMLTERHAADLQATHVKSTLSHLSSDLRLLAGGNEIVSLASGNLDLRATRKLLAREFSLFATTREIYDQVRFIDRSGMEIVRVNYDGKRAESVPDAQLQLKENRYYFQESIRLDKGQVYLSPFDLNVEHGEIETPLKPMLRLATPVTSAQGKVNGVVVLNYLGRDLLDTLRGAAATARGRPMLVNTKGYWLLAEDPALEWGFMYPERASLTFAATYPKTWKAMHGSSEGQISNQHGLFTYQRILPRQAVALGGHVPARTGGEERVWYSILHIPQAEFSGYSRSLLFYLFGLGAALFLLAATGSWVLAMAITKRKLYQRRLRIMAHYDLLTGLPNRTLFFDRLDQTFERARRYERSFGLLFIDVDDFKAINDSLGHEAGDELLRTISLRILDVLRTSDTAARLGGDEFVVILPEASRRMDVNTVAQKLLDSMATPVELNGEERLVTLSIGTALYPEDGQDLEPLLASADRAMYTAKAHGKNAYI